MYSLHLFTSINIYVFIAVYECKNKNYKRCDMWRGLKHIGEVLILSLIVMWPHSGIQ